ncbi:electron transfer flavoprotein subunit alpha/FixB family protein [Candidatus Rariloculus sp.]|uniref:electron transfer flavoprotein subunit alpha/FixB family protein n=1 Tax=Candidatus Rariloculus sp. TaxID=3101265 RepID=UPI003D0CA80B
MARVLIVAEHDGQSLNPSTARCVSCARSFEASAIDIAVLSGDGGAVAAQAAALAGVTGVIRVDHPANEFALAAVAAPQIRDLAADYTHVFGPSTTFGKDLMPRVAALMGVGQLSDIMSAESAYRFKRPIYAGNAILTVEAPADRTVVATVRTASYQAAEATGEAEIRKRSMDTELPDHTRFIELRSDTGNGRPDLQTGARVVSGGRALGSKENFEIIYRLADTLGAAVGASRAAVDSGYAGNDMQVGQTGKIIAPDLYIAVGISGAIQHLTGIKDAGMIVAINIDAEAPLFEVADIGLAADLFTAVPELIEALGG